MNSVFARRQLEKHGWTDGDGLGRKKDGMSQPIKVNLKMDKTGVGHDPGKEFTDHWWMRAFNDAAKKTKKSDESQQKEKSEENKRKAEMSAKKKNFYKGFVKGTTLTNGCETKDSDQSSSEDETLEQDKTSIPTLDDLHKFCDGATGHRAARFGIKMKGKLSRVAAHDKEFEEQSKIDPGILNVTGKDTSSANISSNNTQAMDEDMEMSLNIAKNSDDNQFTEKDLHEGNEALPEPLVLSETEKKKKKKRKKEKDDNIDKDRELENATENTACSLSNEVEPELNEEKGKKKKKKRKIDTVVEEAAINDCISTSNREIEDGSLKSKIFDEPEKQKHPGTKKKKKRKTDKLVEEATMNESDCAGSRNVDENLRSDKPDELQSQEQPGPKKKRKRKTDTLVEETAINDCESTGSRDIDNAHLRSDDPDKTDCQEQPGTMIKKKRVKDQDEVLPNNNGDVDNDSLQKGQRKKEKKRKDKASPSEEITNILHKTDLIGKDIQMSDKVNGCGNMGNKEELLDAEIPKKKKKKSQDSDLSVQDLAMSNDSPHTSSKRKKSKIHIGEKNVLEHGISEETKEKKKKKKK